MQKRNNITYKAIYRCIIHVLTCIWNIGYLSIFLIKFYVLKRIVIDKYYIPAKRYVYNVYRYKSQYYNDIIIR